MSTCKYCGESIIFAQAPDIKKWFAFPASVRNKYTGKDDLNWDNVDQIDKLIHNCRGRNKKQ